MPAAWFHVHPFPKRALRVRTMVMAGVVVTSWGPEWDNCCCVSVQVLDRRVVHFAKFKAVHL